MPHVSDLGVGPPQDPVVLDWANAQLPMTWPDQLNLLRPRDLFAFVRRIVGPRLPVELPANVPGRAWLPPYVLQEFHHLPNGVYSDRVARAYGAWFERVMLGVMRATRRAIAAVLAATDTVLDLGCGDGALAGALRAQGTREVWGLDPCPYLLKRAAQRHRDVRFVHGLAEATGFPDRRFGGIGACFVFHELPPAAADQGLAEVCRILKPGGALVIAEPAPEQLGAGNLGELLRAHGPRALYFGLLARLMYEPAVSAWHARDLRKWFSRGGLVLERDASEIPVRLIVGRKPA